jgi:hypothetical protein
MRFIAGWKTKLGNLMVATGGGMYIASNWYTVIPDRIIIGVIIAGAAIAFHGAYNRFCRVFYGANQRGNPDMGRSKLKARRLRGGEIDVTSED